MRLPYVLRNHLINVSNWVTVDADTFKRALLEFDTHARRAMRFRRNVRTSKGLVCGAVGETLGNVFENTVNAPN